MYSDLYFRQRKSYVPVLIAVLAVVGVTSFLTFYFSSSITPTRASKKTLLQREIVNLNASQAGVFWQTDQKETGWIIYGTDPTKLTQTVSDERDSSSKNKYQLHYVLLKNLKANTTYYYRIVSSNELISDSGGEPFKIKTANTLGAANNAQPSYGKVTLKTGAPADNAFVLIRPADTFPLLAVTKMTGEWLIPMNNTHLLLKDTDKVHIDIINEDLTKTKIDALVSHISPLPQTIILGNSYQFIDEQDVLPAFTSQASETTNGIDILFPRQHSIIPGSKPLIKGAALPGAAVELELNSQPKFKFSTQANDKGEWIINVPKELQAREYTLVLTTKDPEGKPVVMARTFTITKSGEQVLAEATQAATPTVEPTVGIFEPTITATPEATQIPTVTPIQATPSTIPTQFIDPNVTPGVPVAGGNGFMYTIVSLGLLVVGAGVFFFL